jgi:hypothetical protein
MSFNSKDLIFTEKYRPRFVHEMVLEEETKKKILNYMKEPSKLQHLLLFSRTPGTGKTTLAKAIINELDCDYKIINSSNDRKIETVRDVINEFALTKSSKEGKRKIIFLDEADGMCLPFGTEIIVGTKKHTFIKKIEDINNKTYVSIPSVNIQTGMIEDDKGMMLNSGVADFYEIELEDNRKIIASTNHPFFKENFIETKVKDLKIGDKIIDYNDEILKKCPICDKKILKKYTTCSYKCQHKWHSKNMTGEGNSNYGVVCSEDKKKKLSEANKGKCYNSIINRLIHSNYMKVNNPMNNLDSRNKISIKHKNRIFSKEWRKKISKSLKNKLNLGKDEYITKCLIENKKISFAHHLRIKKNSKTKKCQICDVELKTKTINGIIIHHIDRNHNNNCPNNILYVCVKCHNHIHKGDRYFNHFEWKNKYYEKIKNVVILYGEKNAIN